MLKIKRNWPALVLIISVVMYVGYILVEQQKIIAYKNSEIARVERKIEEQQRIAENLKQQQEKLNDDAYIEDIARNKIGMVKPGEIVFIDINN